MADSIPRPGGGTVGSVRTLLAGLALSLIPSVALADRLEVLGGSSGEATELSHTIDVTVEPGLAVLRVDRTIKFTGKGKADIALYASLPQGGVITGLKLQSGGEVEAQARGVDAVLVFPEVKGRSKRRVNYRVEVPLVAEGGRATVWLPQARSSGGAMVPVVRLGGEVLLAEDNPAWDPVRVPMPTPKSGRARWGAAKLASDWAWRLEVDAPHELGKSIDAAHVVFLLDASRSQGRKGIDRQLALLHEWARQMPRAQYQVIAYHRDADQVFATWKRADGVRDLGAGHAKLVPHNGSNVDGALQLAASLLASTKGPGFVLVGTDGEAPVATMPDRLSSRLSGLGKDSVVHLIVTSGRHTRGAIETRADSHRLAKVALDHGGVPVSVYLPDDWPEPPEKLALKNLLRTTRIDRFDTEVDGKSYLGDDAGRRLYAGQGAVATGRAKAEPKTLAPSGLAWGRKWTTRATRTAAVDRRAALFAVHDQQLPAVDLEAVGKRLAFVTTKTALKATKSGSEVVSPRDFGVSQSGVRPGVATRRPQPPVAGEVPNDKVRSLFSEMYAPCLGGYRGPAGTVQISVEMSWNEILDVAAVGGDTATNLCVEEAIWAVDLPDDFKDAHAFGMVEEPLQATETDEDEDGADDGPPETSASRSGGCAVGRSAPTWRWLLVLVAVGRRRRR